MKLQFRRTSAILAGAVLVAMASGCGGQSRGDFATPPIAGVPSLVANPDAGFHACKGQKKTAHYATATETLSTKGGSLCIPSFGGFGGSMSYPAANPAVKVTITSSTTNYAKLPLPVSGAVPVFYLQFTFSANTAFSAKLSPRGLLIGKTLKVKTAYVVFPEINEFGFWHDANPCYAVAKSAGKLGGSVSGIGAVFAGQSEANPQWAVFVYPGQTGNPC